jgi:hypothetical protein
VYVVGDVGGGAAALLDRPEGLSSVPDYGYYSRMIDSAFQPSLPPQSHPNLPVTANSSGCPID